MPFCHVTLRGQKPPPPSYPKYLVTLGDHLRNRRLDLGLRQFDVARKPGANKDTVHNWESGHTSPALRYIPKIIEFLGHVTENEPRGSLHLPDRLKAYRWVRGVSQKDLALILGVDESTVWHWEQGGTRPSEENTARIEALLRDGVSRFTGATP